MISSSMVDLSDKILVMQGSGAEDMSSNQDQNLFSSGNNNTQIKTCSDCGTTKTPLWRGGPAGPKSLCNACGIRSRKKRRALLGLNKEDKKSKKSIVSTNKKSIVITHENQSYNSCTSTSSEDSKSSNNSDKNIKSSSSSLKLKFSLLPFGREVVLQRPRSSSNRRRKLGEEEQAAFLLMSLSCGSVYA